MDTALILRMKSDSGEIIQPPLTYLNDSKIIAKILKKRELSNLGKIFSLISLSEIPFSQELTYTRELIEDINRELATDEGFSYTGNLDDIVPCYNAMLLTTYCRLGLGKSREAQNALDWIKRYQVFNREDETTWTHNGICRFGGCMKKVPCYIGIGKSVMALLVYQDEVTGADVEVNHLIEQGMDYMLQHQMFLKLSDNQPISSHITDNIFPQMYALSLTDLIFIMSHYDWVNHPNVGHLLNLIENKKTSKGGWKIDYLYKYHGYTSFDGRTNESEWLNYLYGKWLNN